MVQHVCQMSVLYLLCYAIPKFDCGWILLIWCCLLRGHPTQQYHWRCMSNVKQVATQEASEAGERRLLAASHMSGTRGLLQDSSNATQCVGLNEFSQAECGNRPGYKQALSTNAIHQV